MRKLVITLAAAALGGWAALADGQGPARAEAEAETETGRGEACAQRLGTARTVRFDTTGGPRFGRVPAYGRPPFLQPGEVILTFDDGPHARGTGRVLDTLRDHCVRATFFVVGVMARSYPALLRRVAAEGHTVAGHTQTHRMPFWELPHAEAVADIEQGFQTISDVLGRPIAPIFRFPGLQDTLALRDHLSARNISALSVDVMGEDTHVDATVESVVETVMRELRLRNGGIVLLHDPLRRTADALPILLERMRTEGFRIVHLETVHAYAPPGETPPNAPPSATPPAPRADDQQLTSDDTERRFQRPARVLFDDGRGLSGIY